MYTINVVNKYKHKSTPHDFICHRPSPLGNKYTHIPNGTVAKFVVKNREESIQKHKEDFIKEIETDEEIKNAFMKIYNHLKEHKIVNLICYCAPKSCHADTIKEELLKQL